MDRERSLVGYSPLGCKELDMTEQLPSLTRSDISCALSYTTVSNKTADRTFFYQILESTQEPVRLLGFFKLDYHCFTNLC